MRKLLLSLTLLLFILLSSCTGSITGEEYGPDLGVIELEFRGFTFKNIPTGIYCGGGQSSTSCGVETGLNLAEDSETPYDPSKNGRLKIRVIPESLSPDLKIQEEEIFLEDIYHDPYFNTCIIRLKNGYQIGPTYYLEIEYHTDCKRCRDHDTGAAAGVVFTGTLETVEPDQVIKRIFSLNEEDQSAFDC